ncbi:MAG: RNA polymerase sigma factor [Planctomycetaceae bacterium]|nr:MAG: RNA polymerase sigma factor [Planctomycetaceae bacterium]
MSGSQFNSAFKGSPSGRPDDGADARSAHAEKVRAELAESGAPLRRYLFGMCGDWEHADDLAQDALLKAWTRRESFSGQASFRTWVFTIARNCWLDWLRKKRNAPREETMNEKFAYIDSGSPPDAAIRRGELAHAVKQALEKLPGEQREVLALRESEGLTFDQIGVMLGIPSATAKSRARYALLKLAEELKDYKDA